MELSTLQTETLVERKLSRNKINARHLRKVTEQLLNKFKKTHMIINRLDMIIIYLLFVI